MNTPKYKKLGKKLRAQIQRTLPWLGVALLGYLVLTRMFQSAAIPDGSKAPLVQAEQIDGSTFKLEESLGHPVVLNFWASWCGPCRAEVPHLNEVHRELRAKGGQVIGMSMDQANSQQVAMLAKRLGIHYPVAPANTSAVNAYQVQSLPTTYVIDSEGIIRSSFVGGVSASQILDALD